MNRTAKAALLENSIYGLAIGDAVGVPVEFRKREYMKQHPVIGMTGFGMHMLPKGT